jgi:S1-C subfamily serine protease
MKRVCFIFYFIFFLPIVGGAAPESRIDHLLKSRESIVDVTAIQLGEEPGQCTDHGLFSLLSYRRIAYQQFGAGIIISDDGYIVTNLHTVYGAQYIKITFHDGTFTSGQILNIMPLYDLVLLKVDRTGLPPLIFADSDQAALGQDIVNIGHSDLLNGTLSGGQIIGVGKRQQTPDGKTIELFEVDVNLQKGDSGGPVLDSDGRLLGIIAARKTFQDGATFVIPSNKIKNLYLDYRKEGYNPDHEK